jgi:serine/threonine protein kinase
VCVEKRLRPRDVADYRHRYEVGLLRRLVHPHIVRFIDAYELPRANPPVASIYMDYYSLGSLRSFVVRQHDMCRLHGPAGTRFPEAFVWHVLRSLVSALVYLRNGSSSVADERRQPVVQPAPPTDWRPVLHRDIKADNVLVRPRRPALAPLQRLDAQPSSRSGRGSRQQQTQQQQRRRHERQQRLRRRHEPPPGVAPYPDIALGDFGSATFAPRDEALARVGTTPLYRRPAEVPTQDLRGRTDVWFVGSIAKMVARMHAEYDALYGGDATADARTDRLPAGAAYSDALNAVLAWALAADVRHRPDAEDLMDLVNQAYDRGHVRWEAIPTACRECGRFWPPAAADGDRHDDDDLQDDEE